MMNDFSIEAAIRFINATARPFEKAAFDVLYHHAPADRALEELGKFQNADGGFGHALEADNWNPHSNPIAANDALIWLYRMDCLESAEDIVQGIVRYLCSHDSFDETQQKWLFAIDSNKDFPHAIWWEKKDDGKGSGIEGFNPSVSLAAFLLCYGGQAASHDPLYQGILKQAVSALDQADPLGSDSLKCYLLAYELLRKNQPAGRAPVDAEDATRPVDTADDASPVNLDAFRRLLLDQVQKTICPDTGKYGVEYVATPSDLFCGCFPDLIPEDIHPLIQAELDILGKLQKEDGGFDISWQWYTPYPEFDQARAWWRPRITIDKLLFLREMDHIRS